MMQLCCGRRSGLAKGLEGSERQLRMLPMQPRRLATSASLPQLLPAGHMTLPRGGE